MIVPFRVDGLVGVRRFGARASSRRAAAGLVTGLLLLSACTGHSGGHPTTPTSGPASAGGAAASGGTSVHPPAGFALVSATQPLTGASVTPASCRAVVSATSVLPHAAVSSYAQGQTRVTVSQAGLSSPSAAADAVATLGRGVRACSSFRYGGIAFTTVVLASPVAGVSEVRLRSAQVLVTLLASARGAQATVVSVASPPPGPAAALITELGSQLK